MGPSSELGGKVLDIVKKPFSSPRNQTDNDESRPSSATALYHAPNGQSGRYDSGGFGGRRETEDASSKSNSNWQASPSDAESEPKWEHQQTNMPQQDTSEVVTSLRKKVRAQQSAFDGMQAQVEKLQTIIDKGKEKVAKSDKIIAKRDGAMQDALDKASRERSTLISEHERKTSALQRNFNTRTHELERTINNLNLARDSDWRKYNDQLQSKEKDLQAANKDKRLKLEQQRSGFDLAIEDLKQVHLAETNSLRSEAENERCRLVNEHTEALAILTERYRQHLQSLEAAIQRSEDDHLSAMQNLQAEHEMNEMKLTSRHKDHIKNIRLQVQELNEALLTRDNEIYQGSTFSTSDLPFKSDDKLKQQIIIIQQVAEEIARLPWRSEPEWWTEQISPDQQNQRALRKAILLHIIWNNLHKHIFSTPFRLFGEEGRKLEQEWLQQCGGSGGDSQIPEAWPTPSAKAERWRYMTIKECRAALTQPFSEWDPRARLKMGFMTTLDTLNTELRTQLQEFIDVPIHLDKLAKKSASIWLDFMMHRCRIVVSLPAMMEEPLWKGEGLTVKPVLERYGNVKGAELEDCKTIDGGVKEVLGRPRFAGTSSA